MGIRQKPDGHRKQRGHAQARPRGHQEGRQGERFDQVTLAVSQIPLEGTRFQIQRKKSASFSEFVLRKKFLEFNHPDEVDPYALLRQ